MERTWGRVLAGAACTAALLVSTSACVSSDDGEDASGDGEACDSKIGFVGARSGPNANLGEGIFTGAELAFTQYNEENPDCQVELVSYDSEGAEDLASSLATEIAQDSSVIGVIGPAFSGESAAANPIFEEAGVPIITPSATSPDLAEQGWSVFHRTLGNDSQQGPAIAAYLSDVAAAERVFVVDNSTAYGQGLAGQVTDRLGDAVVGTDSVQVEQADFAATITELGSADADAIFFSGYYAEAGAFLSQLRDSGDDTPFIGPDGIRDTGLVEAAGVENTEGVIATCPCIPAEQAKGSFYDDFVEEYGEPPRTFGPETFDAATIFLEGAAAGNSTREDMLAFVDSYEGSGVSKDIKFDANGDLDESVVVIWSYRFEDGEVVADQELAAAD